MNRFLHSYCQWLLFLNLSIFHQPVFLQNRWKHSTNCLHNYCQWKKKPATHLIGSFMPLFTKVFYIPCGARFLPSIFIFWVFIEFLSPPTPYPSPIEPPRKATSLVAGPPGWAKVSAQMMLQDN